MKANKIILNNEVLIDLTSDSVSEEDVAEGKTFHRADGTVGTGVHVCGQTGGLLSVVENGTYDACYEPASFTWDENSEYDFTVEAEGIPLRVKKLAGFSIPADVNYLKSPAYTIGMKMGEEEQSAPLSELDMIDFYGAGYMSDQLMYAVVWVKDAALFNETVGQTVFEDNSVYVSDFLFLMMAQEGMTGLTLTLTAPGKKLGGISSVTVDVQAEPNTEYRYITENGYYTPDEGYDGFDAVQVEVSQPNGTKTITSNGTHDVKWYETANVNVPVPSGTTDISNNGSYAVGSYERAEVNVAPVLQEKTVQSNGTVTPDAGYYGLSKVKVDCLEINGVVEQYKVCAGSTVNAGDFVEFLNTFGESAVSYISACKLDDSHVFVAYNSSTDKSGCAVVLTLDGTSVTVGEAKRFASTTISYVSAVALSDGKVVVAYTDSSMYLKSTLFTVSSDAVTVETTSTLRTTTTWNVVARKLSANKALILCCTYYAAYEDFQYSALACVVTVSGTSMSSGGINLIRTHTTYYMNPIVMSETKVLLIYNPFVNGVNARISLLTVRGNSVTMDSTWETELPRNTAIVSAQLSENRVLVATHKGSNTLVLGVVTVDDTTITVGSVTEVNLNIAKHIAALSESTAMLVTQNVHQENNTYTTLPGLVVSLLTVEDTTVTVHHITTLDEDGSFGNGGGLVVMPNNNVLALYTKKAMGVFQMLTVDDTDVTSNALVVNEGLYVKPITTRYKRTRTGIAATSGAEGDTVSVYCIG